jgi:hypothetical protein
MAMIVIDEIGIVETRECISIDEKEMVSDERFCIFQGPAGAQRLAFDRELEIGARDGMGFEVFLYFICQIANAKDEVGKIVTCQIGDLVFEEWAAFDGDKRLGDRVRQRAKALSSAAGEDYYLHLD